eukprot:11386051-Ditylum_brightwellii.AAC.1
MIRKTVLLPPTESATSFTHVPQDEFHDRYSPSYDEDEIEGEICYSLSQDDQQLERYFILSESKSVAKNQGNNVTHGCNECDDNGDGIHQERKEELFLTQTFGETKELTAQRDAYEVADATAYDEEDDQSKSALTSVSSITWAESIFRKRRYAGHPITNCQDHALHTGNYTDLTEIIAIAYDSAMSVMCNCEDRGNMIDPTED